MGLKDYVKSIRSNWALLVQGASVICLAVAGFVNPPEIFDPIADTSETKRLAAFIVAVLAGIFFYLGRKWSRKKDAKGWVAATFILLATLIFSYQAFKSSKAECTCVYNSQTVLIGKDYTPQAGQYASKRPPIPCETMLMDFAGRTSVIWTAESINACRQRLMLIYLLTFSAAALCILSVVQIIRCYEDK